VWINGEPLRPGELVPSTSFEMEWLAQGCMPFGAAGPALRRRRHAHRVPGGLGIQRMVKPFNLRVVHAGNPIRIRRGAAIYPQCIETGDPRSCM